MRLLRTRIRSFRNLKQVELEPGGCTTILVGQNGQGKTNTLESIYFAATLRPLRAARLAELVQFGSTDSTEVGCTYELSGGPREYAVRIEGADRQTFVDGKRVSKLDDYFGSVVVVAFTPDDLAVVKGAPEERRRFLDRAVFGRFPAYLGESRDYGRALKARNRILREDGDDAMRMAFEVQVARLGARVWRRRLSLLSELQPFALQVFEAVGRIPAPLDVRYKPAVVEIDDSMSEERLTAVLAEALEEKLPIDRDRRFTSVGPHADDLAMTLGGKSARAFASQGQQRAIVLALKIGEIENVRAHHGHYPILLLDDVSSELDPERNGWLMDHLRSLGAQIILSTTDESLVKTAAGPDSVTYEVRAGQLHPELIRGRAGTGGRVARRSPDARSRAASAG